MTVDPFDDPRDRNGIRRSKDGRPYIKGLDGKTTRYSRVTSWIDCLDSSFQLDQWRRRVTLMGLKADVELRKELLAVDPDDKSALNALAGKCFEAGDGFIAANKGTDLHALTEQVDETGGFIFDRTISEADMADMRAYGQLIEDYDITVIERERFVVIDQYRIAGTFDKLVNYRGKRVIADLKTGRIDYGQAKMAMQTASYSRGMYYDGHTDKRSPLDCDQSMGLLIHLPQGTATAKLYEIDLDEGWEDVALAERVQNSRKNKNRLIPATPEYVDLTDALRQSVK